MKRSLIVVATVGLLAGCAGSDVPTATQPSSAPSPQTDDATPTPSAPQSPATKAPGKQKEPIDNGLASVQADVEIVAVSLESFYRGDPYPQDVDTVIGTLEDAGLSLAEGNSIGSYVYDPDTIEFTLCVEDQAGAWATYDTAPMTLRENGETGGCP